MTYQCFFFDKNVYFSEGIKTVALSLFGEEPISSKLTNDYSQLIDRLQKKVSDDSFLWIFCDLDSLPQERFHALNLMKEFYQQKNKKLVIVLSEHNMPLFFTLYTMLPQAHWLLKSETLGAVKNFVKGLLENEGAGCRFSSSLVNYTRTKLQSKDVQNAISGDEWWLMEEIFKGKSLSQISDEIDVDVRRLSYIKRHLMKRLNIKNNIALFETFRGMIPNSNPF